MTPSEGNMRSAWMFDQLQKSEFFHQKLHEWGLLEVAGQIEAVRGEILEWDREALNISDVAWNRVIHRGIRPVLVFAHPHVLMHVARSVGYYRMLAMVSQKSMKRVALDSDRYERGAILSDEHIALALSQHLNAVISHLIEADEAIDPREFDLWRAMAAGAQAQGSWQNIKGDRLEAIIRGRLRHRLSTHHAIDSEAGDSPAVLLPDGRKIVFAGEPDIGVYDSATGQILAAIEIKGGIDAAGVLERIGAAIKSLRRAKEQNPASLTILILQGMSMTAQALHDLEINRTTVDRWFTIEDILDDESKREEFFALLHI